MVVLQRLLLSAYLLMLDYRLLCMQLVLLVLMASHGFSWRQTRLMWSISCVRDALGSHRY